MSNLNKIFAEAAEIAKKLPENLQESAFNRALDELLGVAGNERPSRKPRVSSSRTTKRDPEPTNDSGDIINLIDRTKYPDIGATERMADRALKILQIANEDLKIDGLSATQIAEVLTKKFRLPAKVSAIQMALQRESKTVDVGTNAQGKNVYRIMAPGDEYLAKLRAGEIETKIRRRKKAPKQKTPDKPGKKPEDKLKAKRGKRRAATLGPKAAIGKLVDAGYFGQPRQIAAIQEELKHSRGHMFSVQELSPALVRCVRDGSLSRSRNDSGQYEYTKT